MNNLEGAWSSTTVSFIRWFLISRDNWIFSKNVFSLQKLLGIPLEIPSVLGITLDKSPWNCFQENVSALSFVVGGAFLSRSIQFCYSVNELYHYADLNKNSKKGSIPFFVKATLLNAICTPENDLIEPRPKFKLVFKFNSF